ncbi:hypothetical protein AB4144_36170, partial [Rhizobiaceae sp. 2RAB30]
MVKVTNDGTIVTAGDTARGILVQSFAGTGGTGGFASGIVSHGGSGGSGGNGDTVTVALEDSALVATAGDYANAIVAQSIGGGGGNGGVGSVNSKQIGSGFNLAANVGVGGSGSGGAGGGTVNVDLDSGTYLQTTGSGSRGVIAQSIGGGGGTSQGVSVGLSASCPAVLPGPSSFWPDAWVSPVSEAAAVLRFSFIVVRLDTPLPVKHRDREWQVSPMPAAPGF